MPSQNFKIIITLFIIGGLVLPNLGLAQEAPKTLEEAKVLGLNILKQLPEFVKKVWQKEALPIWQKMWDWLKPLIGPWWQKLLGLVGQEVEKRKPAIEKEIKQEAESIKESLWQRFMEMIQQRDF